MIAQNSAQDPICLAAIDVVGPGVLDVNAGTHYFIYGNFSYANQNTHCRSMYDTEDYMFDTWDAHNVTTQGVIANNIGFDADRMCIQLVWQNLVSDAATIKIYNNTCFKNNNYTGGDYVDGEINLGLTRTICRMSPLFRIISRISRFLFLQEEALLQHSLNILLSIN